VIAIPGGVLCAGNLTEDILVFPVDRLVFDTTVWVEDVITSIGGNGANTSYAVATLGAPARLAGLIGSDERGARVIAQLDRAGVDTKYVETHPLPTPVTVVVVRSDGARGFLHRPGASRQAFPAPLDFTPALLDGYSHFHLANPFAMPLLRSHAGETVRRARAAGLSTSLDGGWDAMNQWIEVVGPCLESLDLLFVNEEESAKLSGCTDTAAGADFFHSRGVPTVVTKMGARGCVLSQASSRTTVPGFSVRAVDSTGAGDCFAGAFLAALHHGMPPLEAARLANAAGALNVQRPGATTGLLDLAATLRWIAEQPPTNA
jgi:sugar/nucleoside kinase (ribokinase family)